MTESRRCPQCGAELPADAPMGVCPKCVLNLGVATRAMTQPQAGQAVLGPAKGLLVTSILSLLSVLLVWVPVIALLWTGPEIHNDRAIALPPAVQIHLNARSFLQSYGFFMAVGIVLGIIVAMLVLVGAVKMMRQRSVGWAKTGAVLAMVPLLLPFPLTWPLGLAMGIWALVVLARPEVKAAFAANAAGRRGRVAGKIALIGAAFVLGLTLLVAGAAMVIPYGPAGFRSKELALDLGKGVTMKLVLIPAGKFIMGAPDSEDWHDVNEEPEHEVTIAKPFYLGIYEVTQEQYAAIMASDLSWFRGKTNPVEMVTWGKAMEFCKKLSEKTGKSVRLPTEAQWEYACRAGTTTPFHTGQTIGTDQANYDGSKAYGNGEKGESRQKTVPVGSFKPNGFGLYDMHGNVGEWCADWYDEKYYGISPKADPLGPKTGTSRVLRGGSWKDGAVDCRSAYRDNCPPDAQNVGVIGFRVAVVAGGVE